MIEILELNLSIKKGKRIMSEQEEETKVVEKTQLECMVSLIRRIRKMEQQDADTEKIKRVITL